VGLCSWSRLRSSTVSGRADSVWPGGRRDTVGCARVGEGVREHQPNQGPQRRGVGGPALLARGPRPVHQAVEPLVVGALPARMLVRPPICATLWSAIVRRPSPTVIGVPFCTAARRQPG